MDPQQFYFSFRGRVNRSAYWLRYLLLIWGCSILLVVLVIGLADTNPDSAELILYIWLVLSFVLWPWIGLAVGAKRYHDRDKSAWWLLIAFIPIIGPIWQFVELGFLKGTDGPNRFGPDPLRTDEPT